MDTNQTVNYHDGIELQPEMFTVLSANGKPYKPHWPAGVFRFKRGENVWVRDKGTGHGGYRIVPAKVRERHYHPGRHPAYLNGEGYALDGELWWDCYPGCRVFKTREEAIKARLEQK